MLDLSRALKYELILRLITLKVMSFDSRLALMFFNQGFFRYLLFKLGFELVFFKDGTLRDEIGKDLHIHDQPRLVLQVQLLKLN